MRIPQSVVPVTSILHSSPFQLLFVTSIINFLAFHCKHPTSCIWNKTRADVNHNLRACKRKTSSASSASSVHFFRTVRSFPDRKLETFHGFHGFSFITTFHGVSRYAPCRFLVPSGIFSCSAKQTCMPARVVLFQLSGTLSEDRDDEFRPHVSHLFTHVSQEFVSFSLYHSFARNTIVVWVNFGRKLGGRFLERENTVLYWITNMLIIIKLPYVFKR